MIISLSDKEEDKMKCVIDAGNAFVIGNELPPHHKSTILLMILHKICYYVTTFLS